MRIGLYRNEYGVKANYKIYPCCEIDLDSMILNTDYTVYLNPAAQTIAGLSVKLYHFSITSAGSAKITDMITNDSDLLIPNPFWEWNDVLSKRSWMGQHYTSHDFESQPDDWETALYWKYFLYTADTNFEQYKTVPVTFNSGNTYYTCDSPEYDTQRIFYADCDYASSFVIGQFLGVPPTPNTWFGYGSGGVCNGVPAVAGLGGASGTSRSRIFAVKAASDPYTGYTGMTEYTSVSPVRLISLNNWVLVGTPVQNIQFKSYCQLAHIIYGGKEYIGWGTIFHDPSNPSNILYSNFTCVNIECFSDAIVPDKPPYNQGVTPGNDGSAGMGSGLPDGDNMVPTGLHGGLSLIAGSGEKGIHQYIIDSTNAAKFNSVLWNTENSLWDKFVNAKYNPMAGILGFFMIPSELLPDTLVSEQYVQIAGKICDGDDLEPAVNAYAVNPTVNITKPVVYDLTEPDYVFSLNLDSERLPYRSFADFARTKVTLHVPFCGSVQLDPDQCIGGRVEVYYYCDTMTGNVCAQVLTVDMTGRNHVACILTGNCAYTQPLSGSDTNATATLMSSLTSFVGSTIVSAATGNPVPAVTSAISGAANIVQAKNATLTSGAMTGNAGWLGFRSFKLDVSWGQYLDTSECYVDVNGRPSCDDSKIVNEFSGYAEMMINTDNISGATDEEKERLRIAFRNGVILTYPS